MRDERAATPNETGRLEAFSDGVFALALALLILTIKLPSLVGSAKGLAGQVLDQGFYFLMYGVSFLAILVLWMTHRTLFKLIQRADPPFLLLNGLLLMLVVFLDYTTAVLAAALPRSTPQADRLFAALLYAGGGLGIALLFSVLWWYAAAHHRLLYAEVSPQVVRVIARQRRLAPALHAAAFALAFVSVEASVALAPLIALYFGVLASPRLPATPSATPPRT